MAAWKAVATRVLTSDVVASAFSPLMRGRATILMAHRFRDPERGVDGQDPDAMRRGLAWLRRERYEIVGLADLFRRMLDGGPPVNGAVAFTIDDGYADQAGVGSRVFAEYDCPVTTFVTAGFLDGKIWMWWDRVEHVVRGCARRELRTDLGGAARTYRLEDEPARAAAIDDFVQRAKRVPDPEKHRAIRALAAEADVALPAAPPPEYAPMTWDDLRACERRGMSFGPHTLTHPILSRCSDEQSRDELRGSWERLRAEAGSPVPVFCYPNGTWEDFGSRETATLAEMGMLGAVAGVPGHADGRALRRGGETRFRVRRYVHPSDPARLVQYVSGIERLKGMLREEDRA
jgi:peptidoglycan/xylan/chitin deacetylase (PgdA/CDA1 family)